MSQDQKQLSTWGTDTVAREIAKLSDEELDSEDWVVTDMEVAEVLEDFRTVFGEDGSMFAIGFQDDRQFLEVFGTQWSLT